MEQRVLESLIFKIRHLDKIFQNGNRPDLFDQARIKSNLVDAVENVGGTAGNFFPDYGVDLHDDNVPGLAIIHQGKQGRIAHIAPIPVGLPVYLHGLKDERQTGGSQTMSTVIS